MIGFPPYYLLLVYGAFLLFYLFFGLANIFHLAKYGGSTRMGFLSVLFFLSATAIILFATWHWLPALDWRTPYPLIQTNIL